MGQDSKKSDSEDFYSMDSSDVTTYDCTITRVWGSAKTANKTAGNYWVANSENQTYSDKQTTYESLVSVKIYNE